MTDQDPLEPFFDAARKDRPAPDAALMRRILADAEAQQDKQAALAARPLRQPAWRRVVSGLGGWPAVAGLGGAAAAGLVIGIALPELATEFLQPGTQGYDLTDLMPGYGGYALDEG